MIGTRINKWLMCLENVVQKQSVFLEVPRDLCLFVFGDLYLVLVSWGGGSILIITTPSITTISLS